MARHPGFERLVQELAPGGRLRSVRRLRGGLGAMMHVLDIEEADGGRRKVTLRRLIPGYDDGDAEGARAGFERLLLVEKAGLPAPRPLLLDAEGEYFGVPAMVLTYIPGGSRYQPAETAPWTADLAAAAYRIHQVTPDRFDLSSLPVVGRDELRAMLHRDEADVATSSALAREVYAALLDNLDRIELLPPCLVHDDFWPGNTVWFRGRLAAVIDWGEAMLGDPRSDVAQCQMELSFTLDRETGDQFLAAYEGLASPLPRLWYFTLYRSLGALLSLDRWLLGYEDAGVHLEPSEVWQKLEAYVHRALNEAKVSEP